MFKAKLMLLIFIFFVANSHAAPESLKNQAYKNSVLSAVYGFYAAVDCKAITKIISTKKSELKNNNIKSTHSCDLNPYVESFYDFSLATPNDSSIRVILSIADPVDGQRHRYYQYISLTHSREGIAAIASIESEYSSVSSSVLNIEEVAATQLVKKLVYGWTAMLDSLSDSQQYGEMIVETGLDFKLVAQSISSPAGLATWLKSRNKLLVNSSHKVENLKIKRLTAERFLIRFDYDYQDQDRLGMDGLARLGVEWLVILKPGQPPKIEKMVEQYLPPRLKSISNIEC